MGRDITYENFGERLVEAVPELKDEYRRVLEDFGGEPYVLVAVVIARIEKECQHAHEVGEDQREWQAAFERLMAFLEEGLTSSNQRVFDLVVTGFVEGISPHEPAFDCIRPFLGPEVRRQFTELYGTA